VFLSQIRSNDAPCDERIRSAVEQEHRRARAPDQGIYFGARSLDALIAETLREKLFPCRGILRGGSILRQCLGGRSQRGCARGQGGLLQQTAASLGHEFSPCKLNRDSFHLQRTR